MSDPIREKLLGDREAIARIIGGDIFGTPDDLVGPATLHHRREALRKADDILAIINGNVPAREVAAMVKSSVDAATEATDLVSTLDREAIAETLYNSLPAKTASSGRELTWDQVKALTGYPYPQIVEGHYKEADAVLVLFAKHLSSEVERLRIACRRIMPYLRWTIGPESPGHHPTMPSAVAEFSERILE